MVQHVIQIKNSETCQCEYKIYRTCKKDYSSNPSTCVCENNEHLRSICDTSAIACDEIISGTDIESTKKTNTITTNVSVNCHGEKNKI